MTELQNKYTLLQEHLRSLNTVIVAFSGGVDSSLVAYVANQQLGEQALIVTSASQSLKRSDLQLTKTLASHWGLNHRVVITDELTHPSYRENSFNRCFFCKDALYRMLQEIGAQEGFDHILNGTNLDDLQDHRPGLKAAEKYSVIAPLVATKCTKKDVRALASFLQLETAEKPQAACLSSRVPYGKHIDENILTQIERAEECLATLGFRQFRVRHHDDIARIEIAEDEMSTALTLQTKIVDAIRACGYRFVTLDLAGFRSGSLNPNRVDVMEYDPTI